MRDWSSDVCSSDLSLSVKMFRSISEFTPVESVCVKVRVCVPAARKDTNETAPAFESGTSRPLASWMTLTTAPRPSTACMVLLLRDFQGPGRHCWVRRRPSPGCGSAGTTSARGQLHERPEGRAFVLRGVVRHNIRGAGVTLDEAEVGQFAR